MASVTPRLADVQCTRMQFEPGDRLLVKVHQPLSKEDRHRVKKMVEKWAGDHVEVLVIDTTFMEVRKLGAEEHQGIVRTG